MEVEKDKIYVASTYNDKNTGYLIRSTGQIDKNGYYRSSGWLIPINGGYSENLTGSKTSLGCFRKIIRKANKEEVVHFAKAVLNNEY